MPGTNVVADEERDLGQAADDHRRRRDGADDGVLRRRARGIRRTGYKFAPWVGRVLAQLAVQQGTVYDIGRFTPARFVTQAA
jgi:hypothetical protein